jgi:hypothetical protein
MSSGDSMYYRSLQKGSHQPLAQFPWLWHLVPCVREATSRLPRHGFPLVAAVTV